MSDPDEEDGMPDDMPNDMPDDKDSGVGVGDEVASTREDELEDSDNFFGAGEGAVSDQHSLRIASESG